MRSASIALSGEGVVAGGELCQRGGLVSHCHLLGSGRKHPVTKSIRRLAKSVNHFLTELSNNVIVGPDPMTDAMALERHVTEQVELVIDEAVSGLGKVVPRLVALALVSR